MVRFILTARLQGYIKSIILAIPLTDIYNISSSRKEFFLFVILVEADCHDSIRGEESLLYTVTMMHVDIEI